MKKKAHDKIGCVSGDRGEQSYINCAPGIFPAPDFALATVGIWDERVRADDGEGNSLLHLAVLTSLPFVFLFCPTVDHARRTDVVRKLIDPKKD